MSHISHSLIFQQQNIINKIKSNIKPRIIINRHTNTQHTKSHKTTKTKTKKQKQKTTTKQNSTKQHRLEIQSNRNKQQL